MKGEENHSRGQCNKTVSDLQSKAATAIGLA